MAAGESFRAELEAADAVLARRGVPSDAAARLDRRLLQRSPARWRRPALALAACAAGAALAVVALPRLLGGPAVLVVGGFEQRSAEVTGAPDGTVEARAGEA